MAQYDLVFVRNNASSGIAFSEIKLEKPPDVGYSLTQNPETGIISWKPSFFLVQSLADNADFNSITNTGFYDVPANQNYSHIPNSILPGILQVYDTKTIILQYYYTAFSDNNNIIFWHRRKFNNDWSPWIAVGNISDTSLPVDLLNENQVIELIQNTPTGINHLKLYPLDEFILEPAYKNKTLLLFPQLTDNRIGAPPFVIKVPHTNSMQEPFSEGQYYDICFMNETPGELLFETDDTVMEGGEQTVLVSGNISLRKYNILRLICIRANEWLVQHFAVDDSH